MPSRWRRVAHSTSSLRTSQTRDATRMKSTLLHSAYSFCQVAPLAIAICLLSVTTTRAQESDLVILTVTQLAGEHVYLDGGSDQGIAKGDTLVMDSDAQKTLLVIAVSRKQAIVQFAQSAFPVTRGQQMALRLVKGAESDTPPPDSLSTPEYIAEVAQSIMNQPSPPRAENRPRAQSKIEVDGRLILDFSALKSNTRVRSNAVAAASRLYLTPTINMSATIRNLPSGMNMHLHVRSDYRYQSRNPIAPTNSFRAYQLSLEKPLPFWYRTFWSIL